MVAGGTLVGTRPVELTPQLDRQRAERRTGRLGLAIALACIGGVGVAVRLWQLNAVGFNSDEAVYAGQAASIAGDETLSQFFPVFRAHPLLFQMLTSVTFLGGADEAGPRGLAVLFGLATIGAVYLLGSELYGRRVGVTAALFLAVMPYHVVVSRQVLLDAPMLLFATLALYFVARFLRVRARGWLYLAGTAMGLAFLTKETAIVLVGGFIAFYVLTPGSLPPRRDLLITGGILGALIGVYPVSLVFSGRSHTGQNYLLWQLFRPANHPMSFYVTTVPPALGLALVVLAGLGMWTLRRRAGWRERLLLCWAAVPVVFFHAWPTKGYQYLLVIAPVVVVLAARTLIMTPVLSGRLGRWLQWRGARPALLRSVAMVAVVASLAVPTWTAVNPAPTTTFLAGSGGLPGAREAGRWIETNLPVASRVLTIGPSMANLVQYYGHRRALGLSVSPNPLSRNPSYEPVDNPDRQLRLGEFQYVVWDAYSADRAPFFSTQLMKYVDKYHGLAIHTEYVDVTGSQGEPVPKPVVIVYAVRP